MVSDFSKLVGMRELVAEILTRLDEVIQQQRGGTGATPNDRGPEGAPATPPPRSSLLSDPGASGDFRVQGATKSCTPAGKDSVGSLPESPRGMIVLEQALLEFFGEKFPNVSPQHGDIVRQTLGRFECHIGGLRLLQYISRSDVVDYRGLLLKAALTESTVNHHLSVISAFFNWCVARSHIGTNPAAGLKLRVRSAPAGQRKAFSDAEIGYIFRRFKPEGATVARFWIPLIMLYTGARPEEVAQLRQRDLIEADKRDADGVWVFDFTGALPGQRIKNEASRRLVPIHPELWNLGIHQILGPSGESDSLLFPGLKPGASGRLASTPSRWFNETWLRKTKGITDPKLVLYSIRHSVATKLKHSGAPEALIAQLLGHSNSSMTTGRYGKEYPLPQLVELVAKLDWKI